MNRYSILFTSILLCLTTLSSQGQNVFYGARLGALANAGSPIEDYWSINYNPAGSAGFSEKFISIGYESYFLTKELSIKSIILALPVQENIFGLSLNHHGYSLYREQTFSLTYARAFGSHLNTGFKFNYHLIHIPEYGNAFAWTIDAGLQANISNELRLGIHLVNPTKTHFQKEINTPLPSVFRLGLQYLFSEKAFLVSEVEKTYDWETNLKLGLEYQLFLSFSGRGGVSTRPFQQYFGFGYLVNNWQLDVAVATHPQLGYSPQISLNYAF